MRATAFDRATRPPTELETALQEFAVWLADRAVAYTRAQEGSKNETCAVLSEFLQRFPEATSTPWGGRKDVA